MSKKRSSDEFQPTKAKRGPAEEGDEAVDEGEELQFEDPFIDEEEEEIVDGDGDDRMEGDGEGDAEDEGAAAQLEEEEQEEKLRTYLPGMELEEGEELQCSNEAYIMLHRMLWEWPCLSFDFLPDGLGQERTKFPLSLYCVAGTQATREKDNNITVMKIESLHKTQHDDDDDDSGVSLSDGDDNDLDDSPILTTASIKHHGCVNRIRCAPQKPNIVAAWSENGSVSIFDIREELQKLTAGESVSGHRKRPPIFTNSAGKGEEGYAMDWSNVTEFRLLTGNNAGEITLWNRADSRNWHVSRPYAGHTASVEDLQWSPVEAEVFGSCSADKTFRIWDARMSERPAITVVASDTDVNVLAWNRNVSYLMATGADDGVFRIWDIRSLGKNTSIAQYNWHKGPITSVAWHPSRDSLVAVSGADDQITLWDLSLERDEEEEQQMRAEGLDVPDVPPQLIFVHQGQSDIKEVRWHAQIPGLLGSTAADGFNVFKTINSE